MIFKDCLHIINITYLIHSLTFLQWKNHLVDSIVDIDDNACVQQA